MVIIIIIINGSETNWMVGMNWINQAQEREQ
jgi:hypothetical protein